MSSRRARVIVFPLSRDSSCASSSRFCSIRSARRISNRARSAAGVRDHDGNALRAARTAASTSRSSLSGTSAITSPVAGPMSSKYAPLSGGQNAPPMKLWRDRRPDFFAVRPPTGESACPPSGEGACPPSFRRARRRKSSAPRPRLEVRSPESNDPRVSIRGGRRYRRARIPFLPPGRSILLPPRSFKRDSAEKLAVAKEEI